MEFKKYSEDLNLSYTFGGFPTYELLSKQPKAVIKVIVSSKLIKNDEWKKIEDLCIKHKITIEQNDKQIDRIASKSNVYIVGIFNKYTSTSNEQNSVVLVNPSDMGNLGTIMREMLGFGYKNLVIIKPCADYFNPKVIRASMGAIFSLNIITYNSFEEFESQNNSKLYLFMLNGKSTLNNIKNITEPHCLVFGNEATGLPLSYTQKGESIKIAHSNNIDSLNLGISVGIALYEFSKNKFN